jgi:hypothetical protein
MSVFMSARPNLEKLELIADALGDLRGQLVFVGGCAVDLLLTDTAAAPTRVTFDVDPMCTSWRGWMY